jgi:hypothetical protein
VQGIPSLLANLREGIYYSAAALGGAVAKVLSNVGGCVEAAKKTQAIVLKEEESSEAHYVGLVEAVLATK